MAVTSLGVNDVTRQVPLKHWLAYQQRIADLMISRFAVQAFWRTGVPPLHRFPLLPSPLRNVLGAQARAFDRELRKASTGRLRHLAFDETRLQPGMIARDGFHPGAPIYSLWGQELAAEVKARFAP